jgi:hypothetical protein
LLFFRKHIFTKMGHHHSKVLKSSRGFTKQYPPVINSKKINS